MNEAFEQPDQPDQPMTPRQRQNTLRGLDKMVKNNQMTTEKADRQRDATDAQEFEVAGRFSFGSAQHFPHRASHQDNSGISPTNQANPRS